MPFAKNINRMSLRARHISPHQISCITETKHTSHANITCLLRLIHHSSDMSPMIPLSDDQRHIGIPQSPRNKMGTIIRSLFIYFDTKDIYSDTSWPNLPAMHLERSELDKTLLSIFTSIGRKTEVWAVLVVSAEE